MDDENVTFSVKDYRKEGQWKELTISGIEFIRRFLMHVPPQTFCQDPALWTSMFPQQTQKTHFMPESSRMQKISFKAQG